MARGVEDFADGEFPLGPGGNEVGHENEVGAEGVEFVGATGFVAGGVFEDAKATRTDADHPGVKAFFGIETVVEGVAVNEIDGVEPFRFHFVEIPLDGVGKGGGGAGDFRADDFHAQAFAEPFLFLAAPGAVANPELHRAEIAFQVVGQELDISLADPNAFDFEDVGFLLDFSIVLVIKRAIRFFIGIKGKGGARFVVPEFGDVTELCEHFFDHTHKSSS